MMKNIVTALLTGTLALAATGVQAQSIAKSGQAREARRSAIVGAWFGTTTTGLKQLITFHADGTVLRSVPGEAGIDPARPPHTSAHGVWRYLGKGRFGVTMWDIFYDINNAQLRHFMRIRLELTQGADRDQATGTGILEVIDPQGVAGPPRMGGITLVRIPFEPLQ